MSGTIRQTANDILFTLVLTGRRSKANTTFSTQHMPGVNGAYYLVQARLIIERGALGIPDMPLTFHLHAALAWLLAKVSGLPQAQAIVWAVVAGASVTVLAMTGPWFSMDKALRFYLIGGNPMMSARIPPDAKVLHDGPCQRLARIATPPGGILSTVQHGGRLNAQGTSTR